MKQLMCGAALFLLTGLYSCKDEYTLCNLTKEVNFTAGFYQRVGATDISTPAPSLTIFLLNGTSPIYSQQQNAASFALPLNPAADSSRYVIAVANGAPPDTLTIVYTSQSSLLSAECGSVTVNNITRLYSTTHTIDSVKITASSINTTPMQNAKIYY
jgi:hypothetical protein